MPSHRQALQQLFVAGCVLACASAAAAAAEDAGGGGGSSGAPLLSTGKSTLLPATFNGFTMTVATELGDKTFMIAAIMAMRYNRIIIFSGAAGALLVMTVLSVAIGVALPTLMPKQYTHYAAAALFAYFGVKLLNEAQSMPADSNGENSELAEAEEELAAKLGTSAPSAASGGGEGDSLTSVHIESSGEGGSSSGGNGGHRSNGIGAASGSGGPGASGSGNGSSTPTLGPSTSPAVSEDEVDPSAKSEGTKRAAAFALGSSEAGGSLWASLRKDWPILTQAFMITFLAEWGDRSQIATIAMAAAQHPVGVAMGAFVGHAGCTALAVIGGRLLASRISERLVALSGGVLFLLFALHSVAVGPDVDE